MSVKFWILNRSQRNYILDNPSLHNFCYWFPKLPQWFSVAILLIRCSNLINDEFTLKWENFIIFYLHLIELFIVLVSLEISHKTSFSQQSVNRVWQIHHARKWKLFWVFRELWTRVGCQQIPLIWTNFSTADPMWEQLAFTLKAFSLQVISNLRTVSLILSKSVQP